jgi:hypothetical protein
MYSYCDDLNMLIMREKNLPAALAVIQSMFDITSLRINYNKTAIVPLSPKSELNHQ